MATSTIEKGQDIVFLSINAIVPSKTNRKATEAAIHEMAQSIKEQGILQPLTVRPAKDGTVTHHEIICGEVRWRGAKEAGLTEVPVLIRSCSDVEAQAIQIIENLQRSDPGPMDEAESYSRLRGLLGRTTVEQIAKQVGKSEGYVAQRLKLLALIPTAAKALRDSVITVAHALQIAPLDAKQQKDTTEWLLQGYEEDTQSAGTRKEWIDVKGIHSVNALRTFIENSFLLVLGNAPFDVNDAKLVPKMGACTSCSYNTANTNLFPDIADAHCMKADCFFEKQILTVEARVAAAAKEREIAPAKIFRLGVGDNYHNAGPGKTKVDGYLAGDSYQRRSGAPVLVQAGKECGSTKTAVLVFKSRDLPKEMKAELGSVVSICADKDCKKHHAEEGSSYSAPRTALKGLALVENKQKNLGLSRPQRVRNAIYKAFVDALFKASVPQGFKPQMDIAAEKALEHLYADSARDAAKALGWVKTPLKKGAMKPGHSNYEPWSDRFEAFFKGKPAWILLMGVMAAEDIRSDYDRPKRYSGFDASLLKTLAKLYKVDAKKIAKEIAAADAELVAGMKKRAKERAEKRPAKATKKVKKTRAGVCRFCKCTDDKACDPPCSWVNKEQTICSNPACVAKAVEAGIIQKAKKVG